MNNRPLVDRLLKRSAVRNMADTGDTQHKQLITCMLTIKRSLYTQISIIRPTANIQPTHTTLETNVFGNGSTLADQITNVRILMGTFGNSR